MATCDMVSPLGVVVLHCTHTTTNGRPALPQQPFSAASAEPLLSKQGFNMTVTVSSAKSSHKVSS